jgi:hypothetical protein
MDMSQKVSAFDGSARPEVEESGQAISWAAIVGGAAVASAFSLALLTLGAGIGLVSVSPWSSNNPSATTFGVLAGAWFIAVQLFSSGIGGYLSGRLRKRWVGAHAHESYFRDTAHGLIVWAVGAIVSYWLIAMAASSVASGAAHVGESAVSSAGSAITAASTQVAQNASARNPSEAGYFVDKLFRADHPASPQDPGGGTAEAARILSYDALSGDVSAEDKSYLAQLVATRTGLSQADAEKRVSDVIDQAQRAKNTAADKAKAVADAARKTGVYIALWAFVSLLVGALSASFMATVGGRIRDEASSPG